MFRQFHASFAAVLLCTAALAQVAVGTVFTYQGQIKQGGEAVTGPIDLEFRLFNVPSNGAAIGSQSMNAVPVKEGLFTVQLDFGAEPFAAGEALWLEVVADGTPLAPRQPLTAAPFSLGTRGINVTSSGNVGIGTTSPSAKHHVVESYDGFPGVVQRLGTTGASTNTEIVQQFVMGDGTPSQGEVGRMSVISTDGLLRSAFAFSAFENGTGREVMRMLGSGNVGIGTATPAYKLEIQGGDAAVSGNLYCHRYGTSAPGTALGASGGEYGNVGYGFTFTPTPGVHDYANNDFASRIEFRSGGFRFSTAPIGTAGTSVPWTERMTVTQAGDVGIGTTAPAARLHVRTTGEVRFSKGGGDQYLTLDPDGSGTNQYLNLDHMAGDRLSLSARWNGYFLTGSSATKSFNIGVGNRNNDIVLHSNGTVGLGINGNVGIGTGSPAAKLDVAGVARCDVLEIDGGADISEPFKIAGESDALLPGMVVCIDPDDPGRLTLSDTPYDRKVAGIISGAGGVKPGITLRQEGTVADGTHPVALTGRVYVWCDADEAGPNAAGDLLTTSATHGHAMKATDPARLVGTVLGKAMTSLDSGRGLVLVIVGLQ